MSAGTETLSITLPADLVRLVRERVATGEYATQSDVIRDGLRHLLDRGRNLEQWLRTDVADAVDAHRRDPSAVRVGDVVRHDLEQHFAARRSASRDV